MSNQVNCKGRDKERLLFKDWYRDVQLKLGNEQWIIVYAIHDNRNEKIGYYSALIPKTLTKESLSKNGWDLLLGYGNSGHIYYGKTDEEKYFRFGNYKGIEPLIIYNSFSGSGMKKQIEISEEFRHYFSLYNDINNKKYIAFNEDGEPEDVIIVNENEIKIKLKYIKEFLTAKDMCLAVFFQHERDSIYSLEELKLTRMSKIIKGKNFIYNHYTANLEFALESE